MGLLALAVILAIVLFPRFRAERIPEPVPVEIVVPPMVDAAAIYVYGESLLMELVDDAGGKYFCPELALYAATRVDGYDALAEEDGFIVRHEYSAYVNQGLPLWQLPAGTFTFQSAGLSIAAANCNLPEGYTLTRGGMNKHWRFYEEEGLLCLEIRDVVSLPPDVYDIFIDVGHGGEDPGAAAFGLVEREENLKSSLYMAELLRAHGLKVKLSREDNNITGGTAAEDNPYLSGARVDLFYRSGAKYVISNHLNAPEASGFQIYSSVKTDLAFSRAIAQKLVDMGWHANNQGYGLVENGMYKRRSNTYSLGIRDYYFVVRETGGYTLSPYHYRLANREQDERIFMGAETILMEYLFIDNRGDNQYWQENWQRLVKAVVDGAVEYWKL